MSSNSFINRLLPDDNSDLDLQKLSRVQTQQQQMQQQLQQQLLQQQMFNSDLYQKILNSGLLQNNGVKTLQESQQQATTKSFIDSLSQAGSGGVPHSPVNSMLPLNDVVNNLGQIFEKLFGSKFLIYALLTVIAGVAVSFIICYCIYCCCSRNPLRNILCCWKKKSSTKKTESARKCCI